jgi:biotin synthase
MNISLQDIELRLLKGESINFEEAMGIAEIARLEDLLDVSDRIRRSFNGNKINLCTIINAKSGKCPENCKYCAQSAHYNTNINEYSLINEEEVLKQAKTNEAYGVHRFSLVTSGRELDDNDFEKILGIIRRLKKETKIKICASLGFSTCDRALKLKEAGLDMYHHNLETGRSYFKNICTTHTFDDKIQTITNLFSAGLKVCSGGIIGMGETMKDRLEMIFELRELGIKNIPINILIPISGTPFENIKRIDPVEVLRTISLFRLVIPDAEIRYAAGRKNLGSYQKIALRAGINGLMVGNFLTTLGNAIEEDLNMLRETGFEV